MAPRGAKAGLAGRLKESGPGLDQETMRVVVLGAGLAGLSALDLGPHRGHSRDPQLTRHLSGIRGAAVAAESCG